MSPTPTQEPSYFNPNLTLWSSISNYKLRVPTQEELILDKFTGIIGTFSNGGGRFPVMVAQFISFQDVLHSIHINWAEPENDTLNIIRDLAKREFHIPVIIATGKATLGLNGRFASYRYIETRSILILDDDLIAKHNATRRSFDVHKHYPELLVGPGLPMARHINWKHEPAYKSSWPLCYPESPMWIAQGQGVFVSKHILDYYFSQDETITDGRDYVQSVRNCEDIFLNYVTWKYIQEHPELKGFYHDMGTNIYVCPKNSDMYLSWDKKEEKYYSNSRKGISVEGDHSGTRNLCVQHFDKIFNSPDFGITKFTISADPYDCKTSVDKWGCEQVGKFGTLKTIRENKAAFYARYKNSMDFGGASLVNDFLQYTHLEKRKR